MLSLKDINFDKVTERLLNETGRQDAEKGIDKYTGWKAVAAECGFYANGRTPAEEAYLDGYFSYQVSDRKTAVQVKADKQTKALVPELSASIGTADL